MAGMKLRGMAPPKTSLANSKPPPRGMGSMRILQSPNWPWPPVCFLCRPWRLDLGADGFAVRHLGSLEGDFGVVALFEAADDGFNVRLAGAGDEELVGLRVAEEADEQVFFHELVDGGGELVFVGAALGLDGVGHGRLGGSGHIHLDLRALLAQRVAGEGFAQLGHGAQIAGVQLGHFDGLAALHDAQMATAAPGRGGCSSRP